MNLIYLEDKIFLEVVVKVHDKSLQLKLTHRAISRLRLLSPAAAEGG